jgi:spore germination protein GerM
MMAGLPLLGLLALAGCQPKAEAPDEPGGLTGPAATLDPATVEPATITVYFPDQALDHLEAEARDVPAGSDAQAMARAAVEAVLAGPQEGHATAVPAGTKLNSVTVKDGVATVDLSSSFIDKFQGGSAVASLAVYSVVNTVTAIEGIQRVQLLFDGQPREEFAGALVIGQPLEADTTLVSGEKLAP